MSLGAVVVVGFLFVAVFPTRAYLEQKRAIAATEERVSVLREHNEQLEEQKSHLQTDAGIEELAREQHGLVREGEKAYAVIFEEPGSDAASTQDSESNSQPIWPERIWAAMIDLL